jgi:hypothetical protein
MAEFSGLFTTAGLLPGIALFILPAVTVGKLDVTIVHTRQNIQSVGYWMVPDTTIREKNPVLLV